jgi:DNA repair exonuclease SbcCD nuclease subunit
MKMYIAKLVVLLFASVPTSAAIKAELTFAPGSAKQNIFAIEAQSKNTLKNVIVFTNEAGKSSNKEITLKKANEMEADWLRVSWSAKEYNEANKLKCDTYVLIKLSDEITKVCTRDAKNVNALFSMLNTYQKMFVTKP